MSELFHAPVEEMNLRDFMRVLFKYWAVIILSFLVVTVIAAVGVIFRTPVYEASVKMLVSGEKQVEAPYYRELGSGAQNQASLTQSQIATSEPVLERVVNALRLDMKPSDYELRYASPWKIKLLNWQKAMTKIFRSRAAMSDPQRTVGFRQAVADLRGSIKVTPVQDTNLFSIVVRDFDPLGAAVTANTVSRSYIIFDLEQQMAELQLKYGEKHPVVRQLQDGIKHITQDLSGKPLGNAEAIGPASVKIIEQASVPLEPLASKGPLLLMAAVFIGLFLGVALAFIFDYMDSTIKSPRIIEHLLGLPLLGSVPRGTTPRKLFVKGKLKVRHSLLAAFQNLANQIHLMRSTKGFHTLYVASTDSPDGDALIMAQLGYHLAEQIARKVLIIDANFRHPSLHRAFQLPLSEGLADLLKDKDRLTEVVYSVNPNLYVMPAGETKINPVTFLNSEKMKAILEVVKSKFDLVLVACADLKTFQDGYLLAPSVDQTILVVSESRTRRQMVSRKVAFLKEHKVPLLGAILKNRTYPIPKFVYDRV